MRLTIMFRLPNPRQVLRTIILSLFGCLAVIGIVGTVQFGWWFALKEVVLDYFISATIVCLAGLAIGLGLSERLPRENC